MQKTQSIERFNPDLNLGLSSLQVKKRVEQNLLNLSEKKYSKSYLSIFLGNICTFFNLLGLIVTIALIYVGAPISRFFFVLIYIANIFIGIIQEIRAKICIDKLTLVTEKNASVIRNGKEEKISPKSIALDDVLVLKIGNQVPTDCILKFGELEVNESLLTGESVPVKKKIGDRIYAGSFITSGTGKCLCDRLGKDNYVEQLSFKAKKYKKPYSELMSSLTKIIKVISLIIVPLAVAYMIKSNLLLHSDFRESVNGASTVIIGMIPSGMFLLTSMALAVGVIKLASHNTLVQDLYSLEMLARVDVICFDKTGTITDGNMTVNKVVSLKEENTPIAQILPSMLYALKDTNQTAIALEEYFGAKNYLDKTAAIPFSSARKLSAVSFKNNGTYAFGAPEFVLDKDTYQFIKHQNDNYAKLGFRVILLAHSFGYIEDGTLPKDFTPIAFILLTDHIREDAYQTVKWFKDNGVSVKVISGDNPVTVAEVSKRVGIENAEKYISLDGLSDDEVYKAANSYTVFGRVSPEQKAILVKAMKDARHTVAMTGDGVNDILALKEADCAVTVASGSDAARNISNIVLMNDNFNSMPKVVNEGRRVINNIQSSASLYLMKTLFTMVLSFIMLLLPYMTTYPFFNEQLILIEVFVIGMPSFFLSLQANNNKVEGKFINQVLLRSVPSAILMISGVVIIEILKKTVGIFPEEVYVSMQVYSFTFSGAVSLYYICKPFNKFRTILFSGNIFFVLLISILGITNGFPFLTLSKITGLGSPFPIITVIALVIIDFIVFPYLKKLFSKIKI